MKKIILTFAALLTAIALLCSCTKNTTADDDGKTKTDAVKLKVWTTSDKLEKTKQLVETFRKDNESNVWEITVTSVDDAKIQMVDDPEKTADVFCISSGDFNEMYKSGVLCKIEKDDTAIKIRNTEDSVKVATTDNSLYAYPLSVNTVLMYYDKGKFNEDEVKNLETILFKDLGEGKKNLSFDMTSPEILTSFFLTAGCSLYGDDGNDTTKCDFNSVSGQAAAEYLVDLASNGKFKNADDEAIISAFSSGDIGCAFLPSGKYGEVKKALGDNFAVAKLPNVTLNDKDSELKSVAKYEMYAVSAQSKYPEEAMELADYLTNMNSQESLADINVAPTNMALCAKEDFLNRSELVNAVVEQAKKSVHEPTVEKLNDFKKSASELGGRIASGEYTKADIKMKLDAFVKEITD